MKRYKKHLGRLGAMTWIGNGLLELDKLWREECMRVQSMPSGLWTTLGRSTSLGTCLLSLLSASS